MHKTTEIPSLKTNLLITGKLKAYHCFKVHLLKIEKKMICLSLHTCMLSNLGAKHHVTFSEKSGMGIFL